MCSDLKCQKTKVRNKLAYKSPLHCRVTRQCPCKYCTKCFSTFLFITRKAQMTVDVDDLEVYISLKTLSNYMENHVE